MKKLNLTNKMEKAVEGMNILKAEVRETLIDAITAAKGLELDLTEFNLSAASTKEVIKEVEVVKEVKVVDESAKEELANALVKIDELKASNKNYSSKNSKLNAKVKDLETKLVEASKPVDNSDLLNKIAELESMLSTKDKEIAVLNGRVGGLNSELLKAKNKVEELTKELATAKEAASTLDKAEDKAQFSAPDFDMTGFNASFDMSELGAPEIYIPEVETQQPKVEPKVEPKAVETPKEPKTESPKVDAQPEVKTGLEIIEQTDNGKVFGRYNGVLFSANNSMEEIMIYDASKDDAFEKEVNNALVQAGILRSIRLERDPARVKCETGTIHKLDETTYLGFIQFKKGTRSHFVFKTNEDKVKFITEADKVAGKSKWGYDTNGLNYKMVKHLVELHNENSEAIKKALVESLNTVSDQDSLPTLDF